MTSGASVPAVAEEFEIYQKRSPECARCCDSLSAQDGNDDLDMG